MTSMDRAKLDRGSDPAFALARCYCLLLKASRTKDIPLSIDSKSPNVVISAIVEAEVTDKNNEKERLP